MFLIWPSRPSAHPLTSSCLWACRVVLWVCLGDACRVHRVSLYIVWFGLSTQHLCLGSHVMHFVRSHWSSSAGPPRMWSRSTQCCRSFDLCTPPQAACSAVHLVTLTVGSLTCLCARRPLSSLAIQVLLSISPTSTLGHSSIHLLCKSNAFSKGTRGRVACREW